MKTVAQLLQSKGDLVWSVTPETSGLDVIQLMDDKNIGAVLVLDEHKKLIGIVTERDCIRRLVLRGNPLGTTSVKEIMTRQVFYVTPENTFDECLGLMSKKRVSHLPVVVNGYPIGVMSMGDLVTTIISEKEFLIEQLEEYIILGY